MEIFYRARYYDPATGEFTSADPLEYVDGMSLYRAYFVPSGADPLGTNWLVVGNFLRTLYKNRLKVMMAGAFGSAVGSAITQQNVSDLSWGEIAGEEVFTDYNGNWNGEGAGSAKTFM